MTPGVPISDPERDQITFPCWIRQEGAGMTIWFYWWRCESRGHLQMATNGDSFPTRWHPDQPTAPEGVNVAGVVIVTPPAPAPTPAVEVEVLGDRELPWDEMMASRMAYELHRTIGCNIGHYRNPTAAGILAVIRDAMQRVKS